MSTTTVAVDARPLSMEHTGVALYIKSVVKVLQQSGYRVVLVSNRPLSSPMDCELVIIPGTNRVRWEQLRLRKAMRKHNWDIYFATWNFGLPLWYFGKTKFVLTIHDLIPAQYPKIYLRGFYNKLEYYISLAISIRAADKIISVSKASANAFHKFYPKRHILPIHIRLSRPEVPKGLPKVKTYFVYVGGVDPRKNIDVLLRAFASYHKSHTDTLLVLLGKGFEQFDDLIRALHIEDALLRPGYVSDEDKYRWLSHSLALIYPSSIEGYGLPVAEAVMCGAMVITGDSEALREIGGDTCLYVNPKSLGEIEQAMTDVQQGSVREQLAAAREEQIKTYIDPSIDKQLEKVFVEVRQ